MKNYEVMRFEPMNIAVATAAVGGAIGATSGGGAINVTNGIGDFSVLVGVRGGATIALGQTATAANYVQFAVYESTAATHAGSAISGATRTIGAATAGHLRGAVDAILTFSSKHTTAEYLTINGIQYGVGTTSADGSVAAAKWASAINGHGTCQRLPHYKALVSSTGGFADTTGKVYLCSDDDQGTGLDIQMTAANSSGNPIGFLNLQGVIDINGHALSTNTPKFLSVKQTTYNGTTAIMYAFLLRRGRTPAKVTQLNT
jgi:hypothetical protein